ncbi:MAG: ATP/GTP-binding protein [Thermoplasmatota archaeon]
MTEPISLFNIGTAGCGKSTLTWSMGEWMRENGYSSALVNLDPGADALPYEPDIDVREWITIQDVMDEYGLGPNGAQVVAADMLALHLNKVVQGIDSERTQYVIFDTPGQIELFAFRESAREFIRRLFPDRSYLIYLIDPFNARTPSGFISQLVLSSLAKLRFHVPCQEVISKADMVEPELAELIEGWTKYPDNLYDAVMAESGGSDLMNVELGMELFKVLENLSLFSSLHWISAREIDGLEKIYQTVQLTYGGGEDLQQMKG